MLSDLNASIVGTLAEDALEKLWFDQLFIGAGAISDEGAIYSADEQEARINRRMLTRSDAPVLMADADKFGQRLTYQVARLGAGTQVISETRLAADWQARLTEIGCRLTLT